MVPHHAPKEDVNRHITVAKLSQRIYEILVCKLIIERR